MKHDQYREWVQLSSYGELGEEEQRRLEGHLGTCQDCREELRELRQLARLLSTTRPAVEADDHLLREARQQLRTALRLERARGTWLTFLQEAASTVVFRKTAYILAGAATLALGILVGRTVLAPSAQEAGTTVAGSQPPEGEPRITNVRFVNTDPATRTVEFTFDAVTPVHLRGTVDDPRIQKVLAYAMLKAENPGIRLRAISAMSAPRVEPPDREVKAALILALKSDENAGVRREALKALGKLPFDNEIRNVFLQTLMHDRNPALRIAAINCLDSSRTMSGSNEDVLNVLREKAATDENSYIRLKAREVLQEVKGQ